MMLEHSNGYFSQLPFSHFTVVTTSCVSIVLRANTSLQSCYQTAVKSFTTVGLQWCRGWSNRERTSFGFAIHPDFDTKVRRFFRKIMCQSSICLCLWPVTHLPLVERLKCGPPVVVTESQLMSLSWCSILYPRLEIASPLFLSYQWAPWSLFTTFWVMWVPEHFLLLFNHTLWAKANAAGFAIDTVVQKRWQCCAATQATNKAPC